MASRKNHPLEALPASNVLAELEDGTRELVRALVDAGTATNTRRAYASDARYFEAWRRARGLGGERLPVPLAVVITFLTDHLGGMPEDVDAVLLEEGLKAAPGPHKLSTIRRRLASLSALHQAAGLPSPTRTPEVRLLLRKAAKAAVGAGERPTKKKAVTRDLLEAMLATCGRDRIGRRDRALLLVGAASGGRRRSELVGLRLEDLEVVPGGYTFRLRRSKTDQEGRDGRAYPVLGRAAEALEGWLKAAGLEAGGEGFVFRGLDRHGNLRQGGLSGRTVARVVQRRAERAGFDGEDFGAHSLRSGFVTQAGRSGVPLGEAMALSGHRSERIAGSYYQAGAVTSNPAAGVFD